MKTVRLTFILPLLLLVSCKPAIKTGYVDVPTVTENALSGVYTMSPKKAVTHLYYEETGQGDTLILLHAHGVDCRMWDAVYIKLARKYHVIRYDLRGYGRSDMPEVGFGYLHADDLKNLMDALHIQKAHLAGLSLGGMTLTDFVALYPERVLTATITSGAISHIPDRSSAPDFAVKMYNDTIFAQKRKAVEQNNITGIEVLKTNWKKAMKQISGNHYSRIKRDLNNLIDDWQAWQWTHPETDPFIGDQADSLLSKQTTHPPVLLLIGQYDFTESKKSMHRMAALCPEARIQIMPEAGHFTVMECPDDFIKRMNDFIRQARMTTE